MNFLKETVLFDEECVIFFERIIKIYIITKLHYKSTPKCKVCSYYIEMLKVITK